MAETEQLQRAVFFRTEGVIDGEPYGPARVAPIEDLNVKGRPPGRPFVQTCVCNSPEGEPGTRCKNCDREIEPEWVTLATANEMAETLGLELRKE